MEWATLHDEIIQLGSNDPAARRRVESSAATSLAGNMTDFIRVMLYFIREPSNPSNAVRLAARLLKKLVVFDDRGVSSEDRDTAAREQLERKWQTSSVDGRNLVKADLLATLASPVEIHREIAALIIATIASFELPHQWADLLKRLFTATAAGNETNVEAALLTLSLIAEEAVHSDRRDLHLTLVSNSCNLPDALLCGDHSAAQLGVLPKQYGDPKSKRLCGECTHQRADSLLCRRYSGQTFNTIITATRSYSRRE